MKKEDYIQPKFKIQTLPKNWKKGVCVWYIDARDCQDYLDRKYPDSRQCEFYELKWKTFCKVWVKRGSEWLRRSDSGALSENDNVSDDTSSKWETSDAFKRACVMRWLGRYLYSLPKIRISEDEYSANKYKLNEFIAIRYKDELNKRYWSLIDKEEPNLPTGNDEIPF